jgi:hypothetical protein
MCSNLLHNAHGLFATRPRSTCLAAADKSFAGRYRLGLGISPSPQRFPWRSLASPFGLSIGPSLHFGREFS